MKKSQKIFEQAATNFKEAEAAWNKDNKSQAGINYISACYGMMSAYLISEGVVFIEGHKNSVHKMFEPEFKKDSQFVNDYAMEFSYLSSYYNKQGYFANNLDFDEVLRNDLIKLYHKVKQMTEKVIQQNLEDKLPNPDDIGGFINSLGI